MTGIAADLAIELARILSKHDFHLVVTETNERTMLSARDKLNGSITLSDAFVLDVRAPDDWARAIDRTCQNFGVPSLVLNLQSWSHGAKVAHEEAEICIMGNYNGLHATVPRMLGIGSESFFLGAGPTTKVNGAVDVSDQLPTTKLLLDTFQVFRNALHGEAVHTSLLLPCLREERLEISTRGGPQPSLADLPVDWARSVIEELYQDRFPIYSP